MNGPAVRLRRDISLGVKNLLCRSPGQFPNNNRSAFLPNRKT